MLICQYFSLLQTFNAYSLTADLADFRIDEEMNMALGNTEESCDIINSQDMDELSLEIEKER